MTHYFENIVKKFNKEGLKKYFGINSKTRKENLIKAMKVESIKFYLENGKHRMKIGK